MRLSATNEASVTPDHEEAQPAERDLLADGEARAAEQLGIDRTRRSRRGPRRRRRRDRRVARTAERRFVCRGHVCDLARVAFRSEPSRSRGALLVRMLPGEVHHAQRPVRGGPCLVGDAHAVADRGRGADLRGPDVQRQRRAIRRLFVLTRSTPPPCSTATTFPGSPGPPPRTPHQADTRTTAISMAATGHAPTSLLAASSHRPADHAATTTA
jgi:hypothetical protein